VRPVPHSVSAQFVVTKHHAYCVVAVRGQALLVKLGGQTNGLHEHLYTDRFPEQVTAMAMCPHDNNIIAFGIPNRAERASPAPDPAADDAPADAADPPNATATAAAGTGLGAEGAATGAAVEPTAPTDINLSAGYSASSLPVRPRGTCLIELINFAQSSRLQTLVTRHRQPLLQLDFAPDSARLLSCSADCLQLWHAARSDQPGFPGAMAPQAACTWQFPAATVLNIAKVHPAWTSVLLATIESLEVRELRRGAGGRRSSAPEESAASPAHGSTFALKWRRENLQVTAAAFIAQGNMLVVSDRGDRLLVLNYHGLYPAKRCNLPWVEWGRLAPPRPERRPICTVTAITECPDVPTVSEDWRSGASHLAVASSWGEVLLLKV